MLTQILYALPFLAQGFAVTLWVSLLVVVLSLLSGVAMGVGLIYGPTPLRWVVRAFSDTIRGIPILVLIFFVYYGLPAAGIHLESFWAAVLALTLFKTAQVVEYLRGAVGSIPKG
ncbi:MAG: ABC transporter permease subunit, partial [Mesorhizobium sp.]